MPQTLDYRAWMNQPLIWGERTRGRGLVWTPESNWFINDPLGHKPHLHEDASEIAFLAQGQMEIEVGGSKRVYQAGDFILMQPFKYHDYWFKGDEPVCLFVVVAPNHKFNRWKTSDFPPHSHEGDAPYANVYENYKLPSDEFFQCEKVTLLPGESDPMTIADFRDRIIYVLSGTAQVRINTLSGPLAPHQYQYIPATCDYLIYNSGFLPLTYFSLVVTDPATAQKAES